MDALLGKFSDNMAARRIGVSALAVKTRRELLGISLPDRKTSNDSISADNRRWTKKEFALLGTMSDTEVAKKLNIPRSLVAAQRYRKGIAAVSNRTPSNLRQPRELLSPFFSTRPDIGESKSLTMLLRDDQWTKIRKLIPAGNTQNTWNAGRKRLFVEAILWMLRTGSPWDDLPVEFGKAYSVHIRFNRWSDLGVWDKVFAVLLEDVPTSER